MPRRGRKKRPTYTPLEFTPMEYFPSDRILLDGNSGLSYFDKIKRSLYEYLGIPEVLSDLISEYADERKRFCKGLKSMDHSKCMNFALKSKPYCGECNKHVNILSYCSHGICEDLCCSMCKICVYDSKKCKDKSCPRYDQSLFS